MELLRADVTFSVFPEMGALLDDTARAVLQIKVERMTLAPDQRAALLDTEIFQNLFRERILDLVVAGQGFYGARPGIGP